MHNSVVDDATMHMYFGAVGLIAVLFIVLETMHQCNKTSNHGVTVLVVLVFCAVLGLSAAIVKDIRSLLD